jgi:hypothetical protein
MLERGEAVFKGTEIRETIDTNAIYLPFGSNNVTV